MIRELLFEQYKNFRILFRNISSVILLILGPLFLILLIGFAYSGSDIHDIQIGVVSDDYYSLVPAFENFSSFAMVERFNDTLGCIGRMRQQSIHICVEFSDDFINDGQAEIPSGTITFYFDNSRKALSNKIAQTLSDYFGIEAEKISIDSAKNIFENIQSLVVYLEQKNQDIDSLAIESLSIKEDLIDRHNRLVEIRDEFIPIYAKSKTIQSNINGLNQKVESSYNEIDQDLTSLEIQLKTLRFSIEAAGLAEDLQFYDSGEGYSFVDGDEIPENLTIFNLSDFNYTDEGGFIIVNLSEKYPNASIVTLPAADSPYETSLNSKLALIAIDSTLESASRLKNSTTQYYNYTKQQKTEFDNAVLLLDNLNETLELDIASTEEYIIKIDNAGRRVLQIQKELNSSLSQLTRLEPGLAEKLVKPILQNFEAILPDVENIVLAFPGMFAIILIFISILFANIVTLDEINSKAFYRNLLAPVRKSIFIIGLMITNIIVVMFQLCVLLVIAQYSFKIDILGVLGPVSAILVVLSLFFISIGMCLAVLFRNPQTSILTTTFIALGFFLFSDAVTPLETMPVLATSIASYNPFVIATLAFKKIIIFRLPIESILPEMKLLVFFMVLSFTVLFMISRLKLNEK